MKTYSNHNVLWIVLPVVFSLSTTCTKPVFVHFSGTEEKTLNQPAESIANDSLFVTKKSQSDELSSYECVRLRRGDTIELTGKVSIKKIYAHSRTILTTAANRIFILTGETLPSFLPGEYRVRGSILFEGNADRLPELTVLSSEYMKE